jgi:hypothetical protein
MGVDNIPTNFNNLWSVHNKKNIDEILYKLEELKMQGQYYQEINMPNIKKVISGLINDIETLKNEKLLLMDKLNKS